MKMLGSVGSFCGPVLIGALADANGGSFVPPMLVLSGLLLVGSIMHLLFREPGTIMQCLPQYNPISATSIEPLGRQSHLQCTSSSLPHNKSLEPCVSDSQVT